MFHVHDAPSYLAAPFSKNLQYSFGSTTYNSACISMTVPIKTVYIYNFTAASTFGLIC